ncbi:aminoacylase-1A [Planococcus citri]|uniref:aminoacylase-1A n=1 Tax=Planococcus citri TaxID=170843 RepID=UPI0031F8A006
MKNDEHQAVTIFRKYLQIPSVHPDVNYDECVKFLRSLAEEIGLPVEIIEICAGKPIIIITWLGQNPELPSILLNSHMDVVPVYPDKWKYGPFSAEKDENGNIYARGAQDMKCVGIQYVEAIRRFKNEGLRFKRTIHITFVPDEEIGGEKGMAMFVKTEEFRKLNIGFALDEGIASETDEFHLFYAERSIWRLVIKFCGNAGHGSLLHENTAAEKLRYVVNKFLEYREKEKRRLNSNPELSIGDVTTINMTYIEGGVQMNVVPPEMMVGFDIRVAVDVDHQQFHDLIESWCKEAGDDVHCDYRRKFPKLPPTSLDDKNPWWMAFKNAVDEMGLKVKPGVFPGGTDCRYIRPLGIPALGFSPMNNTPVLLHDHDEFLNENVFLRGIEVYYNVIKNLASV